MSKSLLIERLCAIEVQLYTTVNEAEHERLCALYEELKAQVSNHD